MKLRFVFFILSFAFFQCQDADFKGANKAGIEDPGIEVENEKPPEPPQKGSLESEHEIPGDSGQGVSGHGVGQEEGAGEGETGTAVPGPTAEGDTGTGNQSFLVKFIRRCAANMPSTVPTVSSTNGVWMRIELMDQSRPAVFADYDPEELKEIIFKEGEVRVHNVPPGDYLIAICPYYRKSCMTPSSTWIVNGRVSGIGMERGALVHTNGGEFVSSTDLKTPNKITVFLGDYQKPPFSVFPETMQSCDYFAN